MASAPSPADTMGIMSPLSADSIQANAQELIDLAFPEAANDDSEEKKSDKKQSNSKSQSNSKDSSDNPLDTYQQSFSEQSGGGADAAAGVDASEVAEVAMLL
ncbi:hypothetical protein [Legionella gresilensis]|uniref:hypothetical protein n=1 Tax=Legionella gresilensis TaxID=91823 RepID=UPI001041624A|nr:hypothetical protein [Legionella gresilensis]